MNCLTIWMVSIPMTYPLSFEHSLSLKTTWHIYITIFTIIDSHPFAVGNVWKVQMCAILYVICNTCATELTIDHDLWCPAWTIDMSINNPCRPMTKFNQLALENCSSSAVVLWVSSQWNPGKTQYATNHTMNENKIWAPRPTTNMV